MLLANKQVMVCALVEGQGEAKGCRNKMQYDHIVQWATADLPAILTVLRQAKQPYPFQNYKLV